MPQKLIYTRPSLDVEWRVPTKIFEVGFSREPRAQQTQQARGGTQPPFGDPLSSVLTGKRDGGDPPRRTEQGRLPPAAVPQHPSPGGLCSEGHLLGHPLTSLMPGHPAQLV